MLSAPWSPKLPLIVVKAGLKNLQLAAAATKAAVTGAAALAKGPGALFVAKALVGQGPLASGLAHLNPLAGALDGLSGRAALWLAALERSAA